MVTGQGCRTELNCDKSVIDHSQHMIEAVLENGLVLAAMVQCSYSEYTSQVGILSFASVCLSVHLCVQCSV